MKKDLSRKKIVGILAAAAVGFLSTYLGPKEAHSGKSKISGEFIYTKHAQCRMGCRFLDQSEVKDVIKSGQVNRRKSNPSAKPCPVVAKEKRTRDGQMARVVYGQCRNKVKVITVIDLDTDHPCQCR